MKGRNEIRMNQATMQEAIQLWLDDQFKEPPKATKVSKDNNPPPGAVGEVDSFIVQVEGEVRGK